MKCEACEETIKPGTGVWISDAGESNGYTFDVCICAECRYRYGYMLDEGTATFAHWLKHKNQFERVGE
jgi:hypothetical protein